MATQRKRRAYKRRKVMLQREEQVSRHLATAEEIESGCPDKQVSADVLEMRERIIDYPSNVSSIRHFLASLRPAFPDLQIEVEAAPVEGDTITLRTVWRGTHKGLFMGVPATHRPVEFHATDVIQIVNGELVERSAHINYVDLLKQLGIARR
jgi:predicted ester cyclase